MANKSRPKKTRGSHYKKYVYGESKERQSNPDGATKQTIPTLSRPYFGPLWPQSQFQKVDVLTVSLALKEGLRVPAPWEDVLSSKNMNINENDSYLKIPFELVIKVFESSDTPYCLNHLLTCRAVYWSFIRKLYSYPKLTSANLAEFMDVIAGDKAAVIRSDISGETKSTSEKLIQRRKFLRMIKVLDLSMVVQSGKNSYVSKLLRRASGSLEAFISSQSSFGMAPLVSVRSCMSLKILDLRLVSETVNLVDLFKSIECLPYLEQLCFPRSSVICDEYEFKWPSKLWYLRLQGGISDLFLTMTNFPDTVTNMEMAHCPYVTNDGIDNLLMKIGNHLNKLSVVYPMPQLDDYALDKAFYYCPGLKFFQIDVAYISWELFSEQFLVSLEEYKRPLRNIVIESTGYMGMCEKLSPNDITLAVDEDRLPNLETLSLSAMLGWDFKCEDMEDMVSELGYHDIEVYKI